MGYFEERVLPGLAWRAGAVGEPARARGERNSGLVPRVARLPGSASGRRFSSGRGVEARAVLAPLPLILLKM